MLVAVQRLCFILLLASLVPYSEGANTGCDVWSLTIVPDVCCTKCKPGNRLVDRCGRYPELLCTPCEPDSYTTDPISDSCRKCTQCTDLQFTLKPCNISSDTVCGCKKGYLCGNKECSFCVTECGKGEEPNNFRSCNKCSHGTFNDRIHSMCKPWRESCPEGQILVTKGDALKDHECRLDLDNLQKTSYLSVKKDEMNWLPVGIAGGMAGLGVLCIIASVVACVQAQNKTEKSLKTDSPDQELLEDSRIMIVEQEDCSFHHPEQEQGGSSESISTQDSESKLIV
ncbi:tumor necrosis factor receptor superfamily member 9-like isoform X2 [Myxocyprinus asiaticus]|uniref:tumor necrosis factor receptor superfamily member 9-like isoform X2 n=1 Tax=Myxocyprinus asiaticus TaxID=70543 RepID=UPI00222137DE|nr:tumor necrosis factor receptor superfamily member 9-like isoform X2 [Myxocyprinus asiaticus]